MATTFMDKQKTQLIKKFHVLLGKAGLGNDEKSSLLSGYGVESSKDLTVWELTELCAKIDKMANPEASEADKLRKRLIAAISSYRQAMGGATPSIEEIKGIACRAACMQQFNRIPNDRLRSLYAAFTKMRKDLENVQVMTRDRLREITSLN
jgi:hypothetical protein